MRGSAAAKEFPKSKRALSAHVACTRPWPAHAHTPEGRSEKITGKSKRSKATASSSDSRACSSSWISSSCCCRSHTAFWRFASALPSPLSCPRPQSAHAHTPEKQRKTGQKDTHSHLQQLTRLLLLLNQELLLLTLPHRLLALSLCTPLLVGGSRQLLCRGCTHVLQHNELFNTRIL